MLMESFLDITEEVEVSSSPLFAWTPKKQKNPKTKGCLCPDCGKKYSSYRTLLRHQKMKHDYRIGPGYMCEICGQKFTTKEDMLSHINHIHAKTKPYKCTICGKQFCNKRNAEPKRHACFHSNKTYECNECSQKFERKDHFKQHMKTHDVIPRFSCPKCSSSFKHKASMARHMKRSPKCAEN